jgi:hypothetical protein
MKMGAAGSSETFVNIYHTTRYHIAETVFFIVASVINLDLTQMNPSHTFILYLVKIRFNIIFPSTSSSSKWSFLINGMKYDL